LRYQKARTNPRLLAFNELIYTMVRMENWKAIIEQCQARPEGQTAKQWLAENGISDKKYYYWLRRIRRQAFEEMQKSLPAVSESSNTVVPFAEIPVADPGETETILELSIRTRKTSLEITTTVSESTLIEIVKAVSHAL